VLFDLDGTLVDHDSAASAALRHALGMDSADVERRWKRLENVAMARYLSGELSFAEQRRLRITSLAAELGLGTWDDSRADAWFEGYLRHYEDAWRTYDDVQPMLDALPSHLWLGVVTNGDADQQRRKLQRTELADAFPLLVASSEIGVAKPDPTIFRTACSRLGLAPEQVAYVGDRLATDAEAATEAGLHGIWLNRTQDPAATTRPTITTLAELPGLIAVGQ
jgi:putative hydrolase of the HAD superfamily